MIETFKITNGIYDKEACSCVKLWKDLAPCTGNRGSSAGQNISKEKSVCPPNNKYMEQLTSSRRPGKTVNSFKNKLDKFWSKKELLYDDFKAKIKITASDETKYNSQVSDVEEP
jgi:hypothetical protein